MASRDVLSLPPRRGAAMVSPDFDEPLRAHVVGAFVTAVLIASHFKSRFGDFSGSYVGFLKVYFRSLTDYGA